MDGRFELILALGTEKIRDSVWYNCQNMTVQFS